VSKEKPGLVTFDFDGTLADTWRDIANALNRTLESEGLGVVEGPEVRFWIGDGARKLLERAVPEEYRNVERLDALYADFSVRYERNCLETTELYPGVAECLDRLARQPGIELAVLSNKPGRFLDPIVEGLGLKGRFRLVLGGDALAIRKPDPGVLHHVVERLGLTGVELWMVGDSAVDVETGRAAGARTVGCAWGLRGRDELREAGSDFLVEHASEIPDLILGPRAD